MKETLKLALEALEAPWNTPYVDGCDLVLGKKLKAITAIKEALAQPEQDPVARVVKHGATVKLEWASSDAAHNAKAGNLYTTPPQRTWVGQMKEGKDFTINKPWVGLTDEEVNQIERCGEFWVDGTPLQFAQAIEAKLKEKNT